MKAFGVFILIVGVILVFLSLSMDTSVTTTYGQRVNNLGLMRDQQNYIIFGSVCFLGGLLAVIFGKSQTSSRNEINCPFCAEKILAAAKVCKHCGRDIIANAMQQNPESNEAYKFLWYENNELALNKLDIKRFADELIEKMPGQSADNILKANFNEIQSIKSNMPGNYANEFSEILYFFLARQKMHS